ncbi:leucine carboxy methyltransferase [Ascoidea rubescens DSM 1968]|uniref:Leucine carboxyl methyltransferase 1 n=1 Tax=Ascoidea rubescens DSM 1968 TaxID=1344418 RepID=A0A1D2V8U6_9ASCO|nr:S-adenosyl-L-methionine-dependent methyltransferase [Ascoidea rubescens DSM 1968]ODV58038.1 S-adenosyl-L-methionine-dependent methyltransferase [Ascoidea rubescens DSM 1968]
MSLNFNPIERRDKVIKSTDFDALSSKLSCFNKNYFSNDPNNDSSLFKSYIDQLKINLPLLASNNSLFKSFGNSKFSIQRLLNSNLNENLIKNKFPLINRGTYIRTKLLDILIQNFLISNNYENCQIISLGAGSDLRFLNLIKNFSSSSPHKIIHNFKYIELEFKESTFIKSFIYLSNPTFRDLIFNSSNFDSSLQYNTNYNINNINLSTFNIDTIQTNNYLLYPIDLRDKNQFTQFIQYLKNSTTIKINFNHPTLIFSELSTCYMSSTDSNVLLQSFQSAFPNGIISLYEPISLNDRFGEMMSNNLLKRKIFISTLNDYPTLLSQIDRFQSQITHFNKILSSDMLFIYNNWLTSNEKLRLSRLEFLDELEEWNLLASHYCLIVGTYGHSSLINTDFINQIQSLKWQIIH